MLLSSRVQIDPCGTPKKDLSSWAVIITNFNSLFSAS